MVANKTKQVNVQPHGSPLRGFFGQAAEVTGDAIELAELQVQLAKADAVIAFRRTVRPIAVIAVSGLMLLASLPVLLLAIAGLVAKLSGLSTELSQLLVSLVAVTIAITAVAFSARYLKSAPQPFGRTTQELRHNVVWLKTIFRSSNSN